ncbi:autophagocytosis associated [Cyclospora cayetanensis]|uniref:Autophagocytosis associated n=1 Tax=Cyclospora cayetanensis TaxID=88456 RepID=A0A1D3CY64_9EIME|nr:autophagocytosis associated [Cyclospora cayetanensis]
MTPQEFVDAGDLLVFKFPTWQWEPAVGKRVNSWLPPDKQFLVTRGVACHRRVRDIEASLNAEAKEDGEGWVLPVDADSEELREAPALPCAAVASSKPLVHDARPGDDFPPLLDSSASGAALPDLKNLRDLDSLLCEEDPACADSSTSYFVRHAPDADVVSVRTYDLSITYDKYFQTPRLWLFGYNEGGKEELKGCEKGRGQCYSVLQNGTPLTPTEIFEDILTDYAAKTVTVDPHPCTGVPTASIHPCKHAQVMKKVVDHWRSQGVEPRPDLALIVLLKFISSVVPTIDYDFTMDIDMGLCGPAPPNAESFQKCLMGVQGVSPMPTPPLFPLQAAQQPHAFPYRCGGKKMMRSLDKLFPLPPVRCLCEEDCTASPASLQTLLLVTSAFLHVLRQQHLHVRSALCQSALG